MKKIAAIIALSLITTGCVSHEELVRRQQANAQLISDVNANHAAATVTCPDNATCSKAFRLAKVYVEKNADMRIQFADDTTISTYNPIEYGRVGIEATKTPGAGDSSTIEITASCKGFYPGSLLLDDCANRLLSVYGGFKSFVESRMK